MIRTGTGPTAAAMSSAVRDLTNQVPCTDEFIQKAASRATRNRRVLEECEEEDNESDGDPEGGEQGEQEDVDLGLESPPKNEE